MEVVSSACGPLSRDTSACRQPTATSKSLSNTKQGTLPMSCARQKATLKSQDTGGPQRRSHPGKVSSSVSTVAAIKEQDLDSGGQHNTPASNWTSGQLWEVWGEGTERMCLSQRPLFVLARSAATKLALVLIASLDSKLLLKSTGTSGMLKPETQRQASRFTLLLPSLMAFPPGLTFSWQ